MLISSFVLGLAWHHVLFCSLASDLPLGASSFKSLPVLANLSTTASTMANNGSGDEKSMDV
jgi:hypothetical protein